MSDVERDPRLDYDDRDLRGGHDCVNHQWTDEGVCAVCHEALTEEDDER